MGDSVSHLIREGEFVVRDVRFETVVTDILWEGFYQGAEQKVVSSYDTVGVHIHKLLDESERAFLFILELVPFNISSKVMKSSSPARVCQ